VRSTLSCSSPVAPALSSPSFLAPEVYAPAGTRALTRPCQRKAGRALARYIYDISSARIIVDIRSARCGNSLRPSPSPRRRALPPNSSVALHKRALAGCRRPIPVVALPGNGQPSAGASHTYSAHRFLCDRTRRRRPALRLVLSPLKRASLPFPYTPNPLLPSLATLLCGTRSTSYLLHSSSRTSVYTWRPSSREAE
jgi:hypothetical protein